MLPDFDPLIMFSIGKLGDNFCTTNYWCLIILKILFDV